MCTDGSAVSLYITLRNTSCSGARSHSGSRDRAVGRRPELDPCTDRLGAMARKRWLGRARAALRPLDGAKSHVASGTDAYEVRRACARTRARLPSSRSRSTTSSSDDIATIFTHQRLRSRARSLRRPRVADTIALADIAYLPLMRCSSC